jgi:hypothetical protein
MSKFHHSQEEETKKGHQLLKTILWPPYYWRSFFLGERKSKETSRRIVDRTVVPATPFLNVVLQTKYAFEVLYYGISILYILYCC